MKKRLLLALMCALLAPSVFAAGPISTVFADTPTTLFICVNLGLTGFFAFVRFDRFSVVHGPEILTTVGIFGCFLGIALALLHFDASNVSDSVPHLLEGVKTAFWASVSGVAGSLVIRARHYFQKTPIPQTSGVPKSATLDDVVAATQALQRSLSGSEEGSLLTQLKLIRQEQGDELKMLRGSFDTFAQRMSQDGSKALIEALKEVIKDFNSQINEQFGDNFKQLNAAVEKLVVWQQQYKDELDKLQALQKSSAEDLRQSASGLAAFIDRAARFSDVATALETTLRGLAKQHQEIDESQRSMAEVLKQMKDVTPVFAKKIDDMTESMKQGAAKLQAEMSEAVRNCSAQMQTAAAEMKALLIESTKSTHAEVTEVVRTCGVGVQSSATAMKDLVVETLKTSRADLTETVRTCGNQLQTSAAEMKTLLVESTKSTQADVTDVVKTCGANLHASADAMKQLVVETLKTSQVELTDVVRICGNQLQTSVAEMKDIIVEAVDTSQVEATKVLETTGAQLQASSKDLTHLVAETVRKSQSDATEAVKACGVQLQTSTTELRDIVADTLRRVEGDVAEVVKTWGTQMQSSTVELKELLVDSLRKSQSEVNEELKDSMEHVRQSVIALDTGLQKELEKSLEALGRQLASLSEKFVNDYGPLTDRLREVVRLSGTA